MASTSNRSLKLSAIARGASTTFHRRPFQCRTSGSESTAPANEPTAHASSAVTASTARSWLNPVPRFGDATTFHVLPFQR